MSQDPRDDLCKINRLPASELGPLNSHLVRRGYLVAELHDMHCPRRLLLLGDTPDLDVTCILITADV